MARIGVVFGGRSVEHKVSVVSARTVAKSLVEAGHEVVPLGIAQDGCWLAEAEGARALRGELDRLAPTSEPVAASLHHLLAAGADVLFPVTHGTWGEDGCLQGLAEMLDLPYVGCDVPSSAVTMDKGLCKGVLERAGLPVVPGKSFPRYRFEADREACLAELDDLPLPLFVKPALGGSSVGIRKVRDRAALGEAIDFALRFSDGVVVERGVAGRELECAVLGHDRPRASAVGEIVAGREFYDYEDKYLEDGAQLLAPARLPQGVEDRLRRLAVAAFRATGCSGLARVDFFLERDETLFINELNTLPGFTSISMYPRLWELSGLPLPSLVSRLIDIAVRKHAQRRRLDQGIKDWLEILEKRG